MWEIVNAGGENSIAFYSVSVIGGFVVVANVLRWAWELPQSAVGRNLKIPVYE
jgi:hypothetical protein